MWQVSIGQGWESGHSHPPTLAIVHFAVLLPCLLAFLAFLALFSLGFGEVASLLEKLWGGRGRERRLGWRWWEGWGGWRK